MFRLFLILLAIGLLGFTAATSVTQVQPGERAVVRRFGRILPENPGPGLYIGWPWGIERVERVKVEEPRPVSVGFVDREESDDELIPPGQMLTGDHNLVNVQAKIFYKVRAADVDKFVLQKDHVDAFVARAAEALLAEWIAGRKIDEVISRGKIDLPPFLNRELTIRLADYNLGIDIEQASIEFAVPSQVKAAFESLGQADTNKGTQVNQAEETANKLRSGAVTKIAAMHREAKAYARDELTAAGAEADAFRKRLEPYRTLVRNNPEYINVLWLDEVTRLFSQMRGAGQIDLLDHYLTQDGINITQFPLQGKKK
jgi:membrane protease subunit HflK